MSRTSRNHIILLDSRLKAEDLVALAGLNGEDAIFVDDPRKGKILGLNRRFLSLLGLDEDEFAEGGDVRFRDVVLPEDQPRLERYLELDVGEVPDWVEVRLLRKDEKVIPVEVVLKPASRRGRAFRVGIVRGVESRKKSEEELRRRIEEQKQRTLEAVKSSLRIYQITEKIKNLPKLTSALLNIDDEDQIFATAGNFLIQEQMNYRHVTFLVLSGDFLEVRYSTKDTLKRRYALSKNSKYSGLLRQEASDEAGQAGEILVPLKSKGHILGLLEVVIDEKERVFFDELRVVSEWQRDVLLTVADIIALLVENVRLYRELRRQSVRDPLTDVYNRRHFVSQLSSEIKRSIRSGSELSLIFIDIDHFKAINDQMGHLRGDMILQELAAIFRRGSRETDCICRYGGDEFVILLPDTSPEQARLKAEKLQDEVSQWPFTGLDGGMQPVHLTISCGVTSYRGGQDEDGLLAQADVALYRAKEAGRNRVFVAG